MKFLLALLLLVGCGAEPVTVWIDVDYADVAVRLPQGTIIRTPDGRRYRTASPVAVMDEQQHDFLVRGMRAMLDEIMTLRSKAQGGGDL